MMTMTNFQPGAQPSGFYIADQAMPPADTKEQKLVLKGNLGAAERQLIE
jgi:hypothetical protein